MKFYILKIVFFLLLFIEQTFALSVSSDDKYKVYTAEKYTIVYTSEYKNEAKFIKKNIEEFLIQNDKSFAYSFDQPLRIVLISNNIQIPNAFSTQIPFNLGIYFNGGGDKNDYFSNSSWLITLFTHEMIHNYQTNAKKSKISQTLHKYLGNNFMPLFAGAPFFTIPNILLPTVLLEGNAVLNETLYGNGGRLYSGRLNALKNSLVFDNKITASRFINDHLSFPFTQEKYIVGGFYMQYLAFKYGINKVNEFFYAQSIHSINPLILDKTFRMHFNVGFEQTILDFVKFTKNKYKGYLELKQSKDSISSLDEVYLSKIDNKIYFITSDLKINKYLNIYDIKTKKMSKSNTTLANGKVFKVDDKLYSSTSDFISSKLYKNGLFDEDNMILPSTIGKSIQDIFKQNISYIDINSSFLNTKLYLNDKFYEEISSSSLFDKNGNIYYFKQNGDIRELYKNKNKIYQFQGFYSKIVDIDNGDIYFISNTKNGSGLYKYSSDKLILVNKSDNIIDAKVIDDEILVVNVTSNDYKIQKIQKDEIQNISIPIVENIKLEQKFDFSKDINSVKLNGKDYNELSQLDFSFLYPSYSYSSKEGSSYMLNAIFMDPIMFNMLDIYAYKDYDKKLAGAKYINERYIPFSVNLYNITREVEYKNKRGYGANIEVYGPLIKKGREVLKISLKQYFDDKNKDKNPTSILLNHIYKEEFSLSDYQYILSDLKGVLKYDRGDSTYGLDYIASKHILNEFYVDIQLKSLKSSTNSLIDQRGIEVVDDILEKGLDDTNVFIDGIDSGFYVKNIDKASIGFSKTFYLNSYFSKFPLSLRKESVFVKYNHYEIQTTNKFKIKESIAGIKFDLLYFHKLPIPTTIKYIENDYSKDDYKIRVTLGIEF